MPAARGERGRVEELGEGRLKGAYMYTWSYVNCVEMRKWRHPLPPPPLLPVNSSVLKTVSHGAEERSRERTPLLWWLLRGGGGQCYRGDGSGAVPLAVPPLEISFEGCLLYEVSWPR